MGKHSLRPETYKRLSQAQASEYTMTEGEKLVNETKLLKLVLNGDPSPELKQRSEARLAEITRHLLASNVYPVELLIPRRAEYIRQIEQINNETARRHPGCL